MTKEEFIESIRLEGEVWKDVPRWEGVYAFSSEGRIASVRTEFYYKNREKPRKVEPFLMKGTHNKTRNGGYQTLRAYSHQNFEIFYVHILVAKAFVENPDPSRFTEVDHIDGNPYNNRYSNLRWTNRSGNMMNPISRKRLSESQKGKEHQKLWKPVVQISPNGDIFIYNKTTDVKQNGFSQSAVTTCCQGKISSHKGYRWMYLEDYEKSISSSSSPE